MIKEETLSLAIDRAALGKRDRKDVARVLADKDYYIKRLRHLLVTKTYFVPRHKPVRILDGTSHKERTIIKPFYCYEQILHHAMVLTLMPMFMKGMYEYNCGSVPNRGGMYGKRYIERFIKENPADIKYCVKMDIRHFFQTVDHGILKEMLHARIKDDDMLWLIDLIIDSYEDEDGKGIPLGYYTSQWFANFYLQGLDHFIKEGLHIKCYVRYMDDMVLFGRNKKKLHEARRQIERYLNEKLDLEMKSNWQVFRFEHTYKGKRYGRELDFMGFLFYRRKTIIRKSIMLRACKKARQIAKKKSKKESVTWYDAEQMLSRLAWFRHTDSYRCYERHIKPFISVKALKGKISAHDRRLNNANQLQIDKGVTADQAFSG